MSDLINDWPQHPFQNRAEAVWLHPRGLPTACSPRLYCVAVTSPAMVMAPMVSVPGVPPAVPTEFLVAK